MFVIVGRESPDSLLWADPLLLAPDPAILPILKRADLIMVLGGRALATLIAPIPLKSFQKIRGFWVDCHGPLAYAAGDPPSAEEQRVINRELVRRGTVV